MNIRKSALLLPLLAAAIQLSTTAGVQAAEISRTSFTVHEAAGPRSFTLEKARGKYVAIHFLLKTVCPLCMAYTHEYGTRTAEVPGVYHVFLKPDTDEEIAAWNVGLDEKFPSESGATAWLPPVIYRDPGAALAKAFEIPFGYQFHGQEVHYPALVILDPAGKEVFRYVGESNRDRFTFDQFAAKIRELRGSSGM